MLCETTIVLALAIQNAFYDIKRQLSDGSTTIQLLEVIRELPVDRFSQDRGYDAKRRLVAFPHHCCADGAYALAWILKQMDIEDAHCVEVIHAENNQDKSEDHYWVSFDENVIDITYGQFDAQYLNRVFHDEHHPCDNWHKNKKPIYNHAFFDYIFQCYIGGDDLT